MVKYNGDANGSSYVQWKGETILSDSDNSHDDTTDMDSTNMTLHFCRNEADQDTQEQQKFTSHTNIEIYVFLKILGDSAIQIELEDYTGNCMAMALSFYLWIMLENPNDHKENP